MIFFVFEGNFRFQINIHVIITVLCHRLQFIVTRRGKLIIDKIMNIAANACSEVTFMFKALLTIFWKKPILKGTLKNCLLLSNKVGRRKRGEMRYWLHVVLCSLQNVCAKLCIGSFKTFIFDVPPFFKEPFMVFTDFEMSSIYDNVMIQIIRNCEPVEFQIKYHAWICTMLQKCSKCEVEDWLC